MTHAHAKMRSDLATPRSTRQSFLLRVAAAAACIGLIWFYVAGAIEYGHRINVSKARGDQSGYLGDAEQVYGI